MKPILCFLALSLLVSMPSCEPSPSPFAQLELLAQQLNTLGCQQKILQNKTQTLWDEVVQQLSNQLPGDMPKEERKNMLAVRNAALIRMFETYQNLDTSLQKIVTEAEEKDQDIVSTLMEIKQQRMVLEEQKRALFLKLEQEENGKLKEYKSEFEQLTEAPCDK